MGIMKRVYNIPCCGGFCAPTEHPEKDGCPKHVSNEYTLPCSRHFMKLRPCLEDNLCCHCCGRTGFSCFDRYRKRLMFFGVSLNIVVLIGNLMGAMGTSTSTSTLRTFYWSKGNAYDTNSSVGMDVYVGVSMRVDVVDCHGAPDPSWCVTTLEDMGFSKEGEEMVRQTSWGDDQACTYLADDSNSSAFPTEHQVDQCLSCQDAAVAEYTLILGVLAQWPTILTNMQRSTKYGDVNCQATMGFVSNMFGLLSTITSLSAWGSACYSSMPTEAAGIEIDWTLGIAWRMLVFATLAKSVDAVLHFIVPTPSRRGRYRKGMKLHEWLAIPYNGARLPEREDDKVIPAHPIHAWDNHNEKDKVVDPKN